MTETVSKDEPIPTLEETEAVLSPEDTLSRLVARVDHLESQNEGLKRVGALGLLLVLILGGIVVHQTWSDLAGISTGGVALHDSEHDAKAAFTVSGDHVALVPTNLMGALPALESTTGLDLKGLGIYDSQGNLRIVLGVDSNDNPKVAILDPSGRAIWVPIPNVPLQKNAAKPRTPADSQTPGAPKPAQAAPPTPGLTSAPATPAPTSTP